MRVPSEALSGREAAQAPECFTVPRTMRSVLKAGVQGQFSRDLTAPVCGTLTGDEAEDWTTAPQPPLL